MSKSKSDTQIFKLTNETTTAPDGLKAAEMVLTPRKG